MPFTNDRLLVSGAADNQVAPLTHFSNWKTIFEKLLVSLTQLIYNAMEDLWNNIAPPLGQSAIELVKTYIFTGCAAY